MNPLAIPKLTNARRRRRTPATQRETTYILRGTVTGLIKIGKANDPVRRLKSEIQQMCAEPLQLIATSDEPERTLHSRFSRFKNHHEWFDPDNELMAFIRNECHAIEVDGLT